MARNMWVSFIWTKPTGTIGHNVLKWLLNKVALCSCKGELFFKGINPYESQFVGSFENHGG